MIFSLHFTAHPIGGPTYTFAVNTSAVNTSASLMMHFISSVRHLTVCGEQASKERKAFDECNRIILSNWYTFCYVDCVLVFI